MHPLMKVFFKTEFVHDEHEQMFNQWERRVVEYLNETQPRTVRDILNGLQMNTSTVYRILDRLTQRGILQRTKIQGRRIRAYIRSSSNAGR